MSLKSALKTQYKWVEGIAAKSLRMIFSQLSSLQYCLSRNVWPMPLLAGLPPQVGIYASIFPLVAYALLGSSNYLNVGPTAVISLMTAASIAVLPEGTRIVSAAALALMTGGMLIIAGLLKAGFLMNFVSRPVVSAYITGAALLIILSQTKHLLGVSVDAQTAFGMMSNLIGEIPNAKLLAVATGGAAPCAISGGSQYVAFAVGQIGVPREKCQDNRPHGAYFNYRRIRCFECFLDFGGKGGWRLSGMCPPDCRRLISQIFQWVPIEGLIIPAAVIAIVAFVDSTSTAQELAARRRGRVNTNKELLGLGASNAVAGLTGGYPLNGSMSRSAVNFSAGGKTPFVGLLVAAFMALTALFLTPVLYSLPLSVLAALDHRRLFQLARFRQYLADVDIFAREWSDSIGNVFRCTDILGVQWGVMAGVVLAMMLHIRSTLTPRMPLVGRFPGTEHYQRCR